MRAKRAPVTARRLARALCVLNGLLPVIDSLLPVPISIRRTVVRSALILAFLTIACTPSPLRPPQYIPRHRAKPLDSSVKCSHLSEPNLVDKVLPDYTEAAKRLQIEGVVIVEFVVAVDGSVRDPRVIESPDESLATEVLAAVKRWRYTPALCDGKPIEVILTTDASFTLR